MSFDVRNIVQRKKLPQNQDFPSKLILKLSVPLDLEGGWLGGERDA